MVKIEPSPLLRLFNINEWVTTGPKSAIDRAYRFHSLLHNMIVFKEKTVSMWRRVLLLLHWENESLGCTLAVLDLI